MHFSIPDTQEFIDDAGNTYLGYNIHINGLFHCTVRYKQLHNLHEQLLKDLNVPLPLFPPKKFFPLTMNQQEERRLCLEKYIQSVGQNPAINNSELLNGFLLNAQLESTGGIPINENLEVYLLNGSNMVIDIATGNNTTQVLKKICNVLKLPEKFIVYFALYIAIQEEDNSLIILRKLEDFESPYITYNNTRVMGTKLVLAKGYWDVEYDTILMDDAVALNLLYLQAVAEIENGWILVTDEKERSLKELVNHDKKKEYLEIVRSCKYYGYIQFTPCFCDYPETGTQVRVAIGKNELNVRLLTNNEEREISFKVTRMRCWRITTVHNGSDKADNPSDVTLELSFEYLMARNQLQWITISSDQAILMSVCLQAMIDELLLKSVRNTKNQEVSGKCWTYIMRDGHSRITMGSTSINDVNNVQKTNNTSESAAKSQPIIKKFASRFSVAKIRKIPVSRTAQSHEARYKMENNAFHMIGDDDL